jgi:hypothetical protein
LVLIVRQRNPAKYTEQSPKDGSFLVRASVDHARGVMRPRHCLNFIFCYNYPDFMAFEMMRFFVLPLEEI